MNEPQEQSEHVTPASRESEPQRIILTEARRKELMERRRRRALAAQPGEVHGKN